MLTTEKEERAKIMAQLEQLQNITSHQAPSASSRVELEKIQKLSEKLELQKKKEEEYLLEKKRRDEDLIDIDKKYRSLNEEVDHMKERFKEVKNRYLGSLTELKDIQMEHESEKEDLLDSIRYQQAEIAKYTRILHMIIAPEDVERINRMSAWDDETMEHKIPFFYLRDKQVMFPKMASTQAQEYIENEKAKKEVIFRKDSIELLKKQSESYKEIREVRRDNPKGKEMELNLIVKGAKDHFLTNESGVGNKNGFYVSIGGFRECS